MLIKNNYNTVFYIFLLSHLLMWTIAPSISNINLPLDTIEHLAWASNLEWGFNKHPPLVAFILNFFFQIFGNQDFNKVLGFLPKLQFLQSPDRLLRASCDAPASVWGDRTDFEFSDASESG